MKKTTPLRCTCGEVELEVAGDPILTAECHCTSCRTAGAKLQARPSARPLLELNGGTQFVLYRKDRVRFVRGGELLEEFRLQPQSPTRRVVARCCQTPVFLEFTNGHWLSLYRSLWAAGSAPRIEERTMTRDRDDSAPALPKDVPNSKTQSLAFFVKLIGAWVAMGFRSPKIKVAHKAPQP